MVLLPIKKEWLSLKLILSLTLYLHVHTVISISFWVSTISIASNLESGMDVPISRMNKSIATTIATRTMRIQSLIVYIGEEYRKQNKWVYITLYCKGCDYSLYQQISTMSFKNRILNQKTFYINKNKTEKALQEQDWDGTLAKLTTTSAITNLHKYIYVII